MFGKYLYFPLNLAVHRPVSNPEYLVIHVVRKYPKIQKLTKEISYKLVFNVCLGTFSQRFYNYPRDYLLYAGNNS